MAVQRQKAALGNRKAGLPAIIIGAVVLLAFMAWWGYKNFGPQPDIKTEAGFAHDEWMNKIAKETGGDISKLSPEDMGKLQKQTFGHGDLALKQWAKDHGYAPK